MHRLSILFMMFFAACDQQASKVANLRTSSAINMDEKKSNPSAEKKSSSATEESVIPLTDEEMMVYFNANCASCHSKGDEKTPKGEYASFWAFEPKSYGLEATKLDPDAAKVYQTIVNRMTSATSGPSPMPPPASQFDSKQTERLFAWYKSKAPSILRDVHLLYPDGAKINANDVKVDLTFKCKTPATFREYIRRVTNDAFSREPTLGEMTLAGPDPDIKVEPKHRDIIRDRIATEWKPEFIDKGLKKFAYKVSGANQVNFSAELDEDFRDEFYQLLKNGYDNAKYKDMLLGPTLMVSAKTAPQYGCPSPTAGWQSCRLSAPRQGYFTSVSFLSSKPSTFMVENNNYGRMAIAHFMIHGQTLQAATNGPVGDVVNPIPSCFKSADRRGLLNSDGTVAPRGTLSVPESGNICQSCHLNRNLASASILFRPFNSKGQLYNAFNIEEDANFKTAIKEPWVVLDGGVSKPVSLELLQSLILGNNEKACVVNGKIQKTVATVNELMTEIIGDGSLLSKGLALHMARSLSNLSTISLETLESTKMAFEQSEGKLEKVFQSYFATETYSCMKEAK